MNSRMYSILGIFVALCFAYCTDINAQEVDILYADSIFIDTLSEEEKELPWDIRIKEEMFEFAEEAEGHYYNTGMCVWDLTADSLLFAYNQHKVMRPASTQKLVTAISALYLLGVSYEYQTRAYYTGTISADSILYGDIYVVGDFDPAYSYSDLKELAQSILNLNIKGIRGSLYADISMKDSLLYGSGWCWDDVPTANIPFLCPLMLERGQLAPSWNRYSTSSTFHPAVYFLQVLGKELKSIGGDTLRCEIKTLPHTYIFRNALSPYAGGDGKGLGRDGGYLFYSKSRTIADLLSQMMKKSDNLYAESMFFHIAKLNKGRWANREDGARQIRQFLRKTGVNTSYVEIADGSGVSLYNYISAEAEIALLRYAYQNKEIFDVLYSSLPTAGMDGTLQNRMTKGPAKGNVHAKTGTVSGVSSLAGYVTASNGHLLAFSIINNGLMKVATGKAFQDRICQKLAE